MSIVIAIHVIACIGLIFFILIQSGRGGGLIETFSSAESIFGTKTNAFLAKATTAMAITFFVTCLLLAFLSVQQNKSIVERQVMKQPLGQTATDQTTQEVAGVVEQAVPEVVTEQAAPVPAETTPEAPQTVEQTPETNAAPEPVAATQ